MELTLPQAHSIRSGRARAFVRYFRDPNASLFGKLFIFAAAAYVVCPIDAIPDVIPFVGWLDDLGVAGVAMAFVAKMIASYRDDAVPAPARA